MMNFAALRGKNPKQPVVVCASDFTPVAWGPRAEWGEQLYACTSRPDGNIRSGKIMIIDIGSHSLKYDIYRPLQSRNSIEDDGEFDGLGRDMIIDDPAPRLSDIGIKLSLNRTLPKFKAKIDAEKIDTICVVVTEAGRAAYDYDPQAVDAYLDQAAKVLGIPRKAINIISTEMEAHLGGLAVLHAHNGADGDAYVMGGNSLECLLLNKGEIKETLTLRMGTNSLTRHGDQAGRVIGENLGKIPWIGDVAGRTTYFVGGPFRPIGREAAQTLDRIKYDAKLPFNGFGFAFDVPFRQEIATLTRATERDIHANFIRAEYAAKAELHGHKGRVWNAKTTDEILRWTATPAAIEWMQGAAYRYKEKKWKKKIGRRADTMGVAATFVDEATKRSQPNGVIFCSHNMRDGLLDFGLK